MADNKEDIKKEEIKKVIDIDNLLKTRAPKLDKWLPGFVVKYLKRILHEDDLNLFFHLYGHLEGQEFAAAILKHFQISIQVEGAENLPVDGRCIFASNHPLGGMDGVAILHFLREHYPNVKSPVNDFLMNVRQLTPFFIPVNKIGMQSKKGASEIYDSYQSNDTILFFPAGMCSRRQKDGSIADNEWKKTFIQKAVQYKRNIVPLHFIGVNSKFFYNLSYWRKKLGIGVNIEMLYLVDELYKSVGKTFTLKVGTPLNYARFDKNVKPFPQWADYVKQLVYKL